MYIEKNHSLKKEASTMNSHTTNIDNHRYRRIYLHVRLTLLNYFRYVFNTNFRYGGFFKFLQPSFYARITEQAHIIGHGRQTDKPNHIQQALNRNDHDFMKYVFQVNQNLLSLLVYVVLFLET